MCIRDRSNASLVIYLTISLLGYFDWPISIVSSNFLALLFISSVAVSVHMIVKLREGRANNLADEESLAKIFIPCLYTALTTMVGFLSLLLSNIQPVMDFGKMMAVGVVVNLIASFVFIPVLIGLKGRSRIFRGEGALKLSHCRVNSLSTLCL